MTRNQKIALCERPTSDSTYGLELFAKMVNGYFIRATFGPQNIYIKGQNGILEVDGATIATYKYAGRREIGPDIWDDYWMLDYIYELNQV